MTSGTESNDLRSVSGTNSANALPPPHLVAQISPDKYREVAVLLWFLALLERFEDLFT